MRLSFKESRMAFINATGRNRKSGGADWRDLLFRYIQPVEEIRLHQHADDRIAEGLFVG
jgi:hypothetical protein